MCHPEVPAGHVTPHVTREAVQVPLASGESMPALLARPEGGSGPAVLVVSDIFGRSPFYEDLAARLATAGFNALLPDYFFRQGGLAQRDRALAVARRSKLDEQNSLRDLLAALDWLKGARGVVGDRLGTVGFCMGGTFVLNLAAERGDLATVCFYGFPAGATHQSPTLTPAPLTQVERMQGPMLAFWGDQDEGVGMPNVERFAREMQASGKLFEHVIYPGLGHGFLAQSGLDPDHEAYEKACDAWTRAIAFYRQHLGAAVAA